MKRRHDVDRYAAILGALLIMICTFLFLGRHNLGLEGCIYCTIQRGLMGVTGASFIGFFLIKKSFFRTFFKWIALIGSCAGIGAAWGHLSVLYHAHLLSFGNLLMQISRMDAIQQGLVRGELEAYFSINGIWTCLPFWSLLMFCGLFAFSIGCLQRRERLS